jgi:hypothetical protein
MAPFIAALSASPQPHALSLLPLLHCRVHTHTHVMRSRRPAAAAMAAAVRSLGGWRAVLLYVCAVAAMISGIFTYRGLIAGKEPDLVDMKGKVLCENGNLLLTIKVFLRVLKFGSDCDCTSALCPSVRHLPL